MAEADEFEQEHFYHEGSATMQRRELRVAPEGVVEVYPDGREVVTSWYDVTVSDWRDGFGEIKLSSHKLLVDERYGDWQRLMRRVAELSVAANARMRGTEVPPEHIAGWLGIPVDGVLVCRSRVRRIWAVWLQVVAWCVYFIGMLQLRHQWFDLLGPLMLLPFYVYVVWVAIYRRVDVVTADVTGLTLQRGAQRRRYAWSDIDSISDQGSGWMVRACGDRFLLDKIVRNHQALGETLQTVLAARRQGWLLPTTAPLPDGAISRMAGDAPDANADRGISISPDPD